MGRIWTVLSLSILTFLGADLAHSAYGIDDAKEQAAYDFVAGKAEDSLRIVTGAGTKAQKRAQLRDFFSDQNFAWESFSWGVLGRVAREIAPGRKFKSQADADTFAEYKDLMRRYFTALYVKHLANYDGDSFKVRNVVGKTNRFYQAEVMTSINERNNGSRQQEEQGVESVQIDFFVCDQEGPLKVCNATVMGFNLMATFRDDHNRLFYNKANWSFTRLVEIFAGDVRKAEGN